MVHVRIGPNILRLKAKTGNRKFVENATQSTRKDQLNQHYIIKYECDHCDHIARQQSHLKEHKFSKHATAKYDCDKFDFKA